MPNKQIQYIKHLQGINEKILGHTEHTPLAAPPNHHAQNGTAGHLLPALQQHIGLYNKGLRGKVEFEIEQLIPQLFQAGFFDLFPPQEWINGDNAGRARVGRLALEYLEANSWIKM